VTVYSQGKVVKSMHAEPGSSRVVVRGLPADRTYTVKVTVVLTGGSRSTSSASRSIHV